MLRGALAVHLRDDERDAVVQPERSRLVDAERSSADCMRYELAARGCADGEEADVEIARTESVLGVASSTTRSPRRAPADREDANARTDS